jgi:hypothetical protein
MGLLLDITGTLELDFFELNGIQSVTKGRREEIERNLKSGDYIIGLASGDIRSLPNLEIVATFKFSVCDDTEYSFVNEED